MVEENKTQATEKKEENKMEETKEKVKKPEVKTVKKYTAVAKGSNIHASLKQSMYICQFIKDKKIDRAMEDLEKVLKFKIAVPFKGEIPHRRGKGMMSGRYPIVVSKIFINILKGLKGNAVVNGLELDNTIIKTASANWAARPLRSNSKEGKRVNVIITAREIKMKNSKNKENKMVTNEVKK